MLREPAGHTGFAGGSAANMPEAVLTEDKFVDGQIDILSVLVASGLCGSRNEARRAVEQGGVSVDDVKITAPAHVIPLADFDKGYVIIKKGKKVFHKVVLK
mgnify:CR=1 FL=1